MEVSWSEGLLAGASPCCKFLYVFCLSGLKSQILVNPLSLLDGVPGHAASVDVLLGKDSESISFLAGWRVRIWSYLLLSQKMETQDEWVCCCLPCRLQAQNLLLITVIATSLIGHRFRTSVSVYKCISYHGLKMSMCYCLSGWGTQNGCVC